MPIDDIFTPVAPSEPAPKKLAAVTDPDSTPNILYPSQSQALINFAKSMTAQELQNMTPQARVELASQLDTFLDDVAAYRITFFKDANNKSKTFSATMRAVNSVRNTISRVDSTIAPRERKTSRDVASILTLGQKG